MQPLFVLCGAAKVWCPDMVKGRFLGVFVIEREGEGERERDNQPERDGGRGGGRKRERQTDRQTGRQAKTE